MIFSELNKKSNLYEALVKDFQIYPGRLFKRGVSSGVGVRSVIYGSLFEFVIHSLQYLFTIFSPSSYVLHKSSILNLLNLSMTLDPFFLQYTLYLQL